MLSHPPGINGGNKHLANQGFRKNQTSIYSEIQKMKYLLKRYIERGIKLEVKYIRC